jgi:hypothetical protein
MKIENGYVIDANNNKACISFFGSEVAAKKSLGSLKHCINCINCINCTDCEQCMHCTDCRGCTDEIGLTGYNFN